MPQDEGSDRSLRLARLRDLGIFAVLALIVAGFGAASRDHAFVSRENLVNLLRQSSILMVAAAGMTLIVLTGGIDLAVGSLMALVGLLAAMAGRSGLAAADGGAPALLILAGMAAFGFTWGGVTALSITRLQVPPLITTLATMSIGRGLAQWVTAGASVRNPTPANPSTTWEWLTWAGSGSLWGIPAPVVVATLVVLLVAFLLRGTTFGTWLYGIGCNEEACRLSGVDVRGVKLVAYGLAGAIFALAGVMNLGRQGYASPAAATGFELDVVTAVVLGGVSITGGEGKVTGVVAGVLILGCLDNGLTMLAKEPYQILVVKGAALLLAVVFDRLLRRSTS